MKKIICFALVVLMLSMMLIGCAKTLSGTYTNEIDALIMGTKTSFTFKGSKVILTNTTTTVLGGSKPVEIEGKYEITEAADGTQTITFTFESDNEDADTYEGTHTFEETEDGIKIGIIPFKKQ